jgi:hypothetical protein
MEVVLKHWIGPDAALAGGLNTRLVQGEEKTQIGPAFRANQAGGETGFRSAKDKRNQQVTQAALIP